MSKESDSQLPGLWEHREVKRELATLLASIKGSGLTTEESRLVSSVVDALVATLLIRLLTKPSGYGSMADVLEEAAVRVGVAGVLDSERDG